MRHRYLGVVNILILAIFQVSMAGPVYMQTKVFYQNESQLEQLKSKHLDIVAEQETYIEIINFPDQLEELTNLGFVTEIIHEDLTAFYQSRLDPTRDMGGYKTLAEVTAYIDGMIADHPDLVSQRVGIGQTLQGRTMWAVKISDNPEIDEDEPEVLYTGCTHAREVITPEVIMYFMDYLTDNYGTDPEATFLVNERELWFVPIVNHDGYYHNEVISPAGGGMWRKNRRLNLDGSYGIDLNRNYGIGWGYNDIGSSPVGSDETYRGTGPFSEPATQNMRDFMIGREFAFVIDYHSYTNVYCLPYGYNSSATPDHNLFVAICDSLGVYNGYPNALMGINGCSSDWAYGEQTLKNKCLAILPEVGTTDDGFWPPLERVPYLKSVNLEPNKLIAYLAGNPESIYPPVSPVLNLPAEVSTEGYDVNWTMNDPYNTIENFELYQFKYEGGITDAAVSIEGYDYYGFIVSEARSHSAPASYFSGAKNSEIRYFRTINPYEVQAGDAIRFWTYYDIQERYDYAYVEVSTDGIDYTPLPGNLTTNYNPNGLNRGNGITGSSGGWVQGVFDLSDYVGMSVYIGLSYYTNESLTKEGIYFDDISPVGAFTEVTVLSSSITDNHYTITDQTAGWYYYKVRARDSEGQWSEFSNLGETIAKSPYICGNVDDNEDINILDIVLIINYVYKDGPAPLVLEAANVNSDADINILDIVLLINYVYKDGPDPYCLN